MRPEEAARDILVVSVVAVCSSRDHGGVATPHYRPSTMSISGALAICHGDAAPTIFEPLCAGLSRRTRTPIHVVSVSTYAALPDVVDSGIADVALAPPMVALDLIRWGVAVPVAAAVRRGVTHYQAALATRLGGAKSIRAFEGARIAWVSKLSAAGYVIPRLWMESQGLDPDRHFREQVFSQSHAAALDALARGRVDLAATYVVSGDDAGLAHPSRELEILSAFGPVPSEVVVVSVRVDEARRKRLAAAFVDVDLASLAPLSRLFEIDGFSFAGDEHLDGVRELLSRARASAPPGAGAHLRM
jgi:phosphonate transport system substrate-binding protein